MNKFIEPQITVTKIRTDAIMNGGDILDPIPGVGEGSQELLE